MDKLAVDQVSGITIVILSIYPNARLHILFKFGHCFTDAIPKGRHNIFVLVEAVADGDRFRRVEIQVVTYPTIFSISCGKLFAGSGVYVVAK